MKLSEYVSLSEFEHSETATRKGYNQSMTPEQIESAKELCEKIFEPLRKFRGAPIFISSGFRGQELNRAISGASGSQHCRGQAMDVKLTVKEFHLIKDNLDFDQLIAEFPVNGIPSWIHVSYDRFKVKQRNEVLIAVKKNGKTVYLPYKGNEKLVN